MDETNQTTCRKLKVDLQMVSLLMVHLEGHVMLTEGLAEVHIFIVILHRASTHSCLFYMLAAFVLMTVYSD
jgi:hypothetical protein